MSASTLLNGILIGLAGVFIGLVQVAGINPLAIGFMAAVCMNRKSVPVAYFGLICGLAVNSSQSDFIRYGIIMLGVTLLLCGKSFDTMGRNHFSMALFAGMVTLGVDVSVYIFVKHSIGWFECLLEAVLVTAVAVVYARAIYVITDDSLSVATDSTAAIGVILLLAGVLYGMPLSVGTIVLAEPFAIFTILGAMYVFGLGVGLAWTSAACMVLSVLSGSNIYMTAWIPIFVMSYAIITLLHGRRFLFAMVFSALYILYGAMFYEQLIDEDGLKALISGVMLFVLLPHSVLLQIGRQMKDGALTENSTEWGRLMLDRIGELANAFKRIDYTMALSPEAGIAFKDVGGIIEDFTTRLERAVPLKKTIEARIIDELSGYDMEVKNLAAIRNEGDFLEVYITARIKRGRLVAADVVKRVVEKHLGLPFELSDESRNIVGRNYEIIAMRQKAAYHCITEVRKLSRYDEEVSGDNFYIGDMRNGQKLIMLADGMGNGERASSDSMALIDAMEELLNVGFDKDMSIKIVNAYLSRRNYGETFATLDMVLIDLFTGYGRIYKQGAATTYIKRGEWLEMIKSTSLPVGVIEGAACEKCGKKLYTNDIIVMCSDGMLESMVVENKEEYMQDFLMNLESDSPEDIADELVDCIRSQSGNRLKDDATIIVCKLVKSL